MFTMSTVKDSTAHNNPTLYFCNSCARFDKIHINIVVLLPLHGLHVSPNVHWLLHSPARSHSGVGYHSRYCNASLHKQLDFTIWCTIYDVNWSRMPVWVYALNATHATFRVQASSHHIIPSDRERYYWTFTSSAQSISEVAAWWTESLPVVLLGIHTALKDDIHCSAAELVYGTTVRLPGEFFLPNKDSETGDLMTGLMNWLSNNDILGRGWNTLLGILTASDTLDLGTSEIWTSLNSVHTWECIFNKSI